VATQLSRVLLALTLAGCASADDTKNEDDQARSSAEETGGRSSSRDAGAPDETATDNDDHGAESPANGLEGQVGSNSADPEPQSADGGTADDDLNTPATNDETRSGDPAEPLESNPEQTSDGDEPIDGESNTVPLPPNDAAASQRIGPGGGIFQVGERLVLTVPPGALATEVEIAAFEVPLAEGTQAGNAVPRSAAWDLQPSGITFATPASLTIRVELGDSELGAGFIAWRDGDAWVELDPCTVGDDEVTCFLEHFTLFGLFGDADVVLPEDSICGDGAVGPNEECDDGNDDNSDACTTSCEAARCGDGFIQDGEECDDAGEGSEVGPGVCSDECTIAICGNGIREAGELCDDGNDVQTDDCTNACVTATCGDGFVQPGEECDDANDNNRDECLDTCVSAECGDGVRADTEECDDGNKSDTDNCTNQCTFPT
jgi:cysteine-rich repeat protein